MLVAVPRSAAGLAARVIHPVPTLLGPAVDFGTAGRTGTRDMGDEAGPVVPADVLWAVEQYGRSRRLAVENLLALQDAARAGDAERVKTTELRRETLVRTMGVLRVRMLEAIDAWAW
jgi:hypothetical protein